MVGFSNNQTYKSGNNNWKDGKLKLQTKTPDRINLGEAYVGLFSKM